MKKIVLFSFDNIEAKIICQNMDTSIQTKECFQSSYQQFKFDLEIVTGHKMSTDIPFNFLHKF